MHDKDSSAQLDVQSEKSRIPIMKPAGGPLPSDFTI